MLAERGEGTFARSANASLMWDARGRGWTAMSAKVGRATREFRLDDDFWRFRKERAHRVTRWAPALLVASLVCLPLGILLWGFVLPRFALLLFFGFGFAISLMAILVRPNDPTRMVLDSDAITLYRANGKKSVLPLKAGSRIGLYDSTALKSGTTFVLRFGSGTPPRGDYLLLYGRALRNEPFELTKEAFDAIKQEMLARGATILLDGALSPGSTTTLTEFRLPASHM